MASCILKFHLLTVPANPLPLEVPVTSTFFISPNKSTEKELPTFNSPISSLETENSHNPSPGSTETFLNFPASDRFKCFSFLLPVVTCTEEYPSVSFVLTCVMMLGSMLTTVTG